MKKRLLLAISLLIVALAAIAQPTLTVNLLIDAARRMAWTLVGVNGGIPVRNTSCASIAPYTGLPATINNAIASCTSGQVVNLQAGTFSISGGIAWVGKSGVTLRGAGANSTFVVFTDDGGCHGLAASVCIDSSDTSWVGGPSNTADWTAGYSRGTTSITISAHTNLKVGMPMLLDQLDDGSDPGDIYHCATTSPPCSLEGNGNNGYRTGRNQGQVVEVVSCGTSTPGASCTSNTIGIRRALYAINWTSGKTPQAWWANSPVTGNGIENMSLDHSANGNGGAGGRGIEMFNCLDCWVKGIRSIKSNRSHVEILESGRITVRDSYFYNTQNAVSQSYGVSPYGSTDVLVENNIFQYITTPIQNNGCTGCVFGYNYTINNYYEQSSGYVMPSFMVHTAGTDYDLYEGNIGTQTQADVFHGTHNLVTYFRNYLMATQPACWNGVGHDGFTTCSSHQIALDILSYSREFNVIGNVLGTTSVSNGYESGTKPIYALGSGNTEGAVTVPPDSLVGTTFMRWGNCDAITGFSSCAFTNAEVPTSLSTYANPIPPSHRLPSSLYLTAKPPFWSSSKPWPGIGPDVSGGNTSGVGGHVYTLPAQDCYISVMGGPTDGTGAVLAFDPASCY